MSIDNFVPEERDPRIEPPTRGDERSTLLGFLDWYRRSLELKCTGLDGEQLEGWNSWREEVAFADAFVASAPDLDITGNERWRGAVSLRWVLVHMIEEYARHLGHVDLLRQRIDGAVGQ